MEFIYRHIKKILYIPDESKNIESWKVIFLWLIRLFVFFVAIATILSGDWEMGFITLGAAIAITAPAIITRDKIKYFPVEIELMLFIIVLIQYVLGEIADLYYTTPYFDKFVHFTVPFLMAAISYVIIFTMSKSGKLYAARWAIFMLTVLITMGIGGIWEIIEYGLEFLRRNYFPDWVVYQGSLVEDPYYDTMNDLLADFLGAILGAIFTLKFIVSDTQDSRTQELIEDVNKEILE